jgi:hypothetical protein
MNSHPIRHALFSGLLLAPALVAWTPRATAQEAPEAGPAEDQDLEIGESPERYAQVRKVEGTVVLRKGDTEEALSRGVPVGEGDVVESHGRGILQLGDGSTVAFGPDTRFRIAALFSDQDETRRVLLVLERGSLRVSRGTLSDAVLRVDTPTGSGTLGSRGAGMARPDATFALTPEGNGSRLVFLVHGGQATLTKGTQIAQVFAGQRLTVYGPEDGLDRISDFNTFSLGEFDQWAGPLMTPPPSQSASKVPEEIRYFAGDLDENGKWVFLDDEDSWVWSPTAVTVDWQPYSVGYWGAYDGGLTWVSGEPWGYVTYHHGRWGWRGGIGWYWIPGIYYSPAWVAWNCQGGWFGWAPLGHHNKPCHRHDGSCWNIVEVHNLHRRDLRNRFEQDPGIRRAFDGPGGASGPWFRGRVVVSAGELRDPQRFHALIDHREILRERVTGYARLSEAATGRVLLRAGTRQPGTTRVGFSQLEHPTNLAAQANPILRTLPPPLPRRDRNDGRRGTGGAVGFAPSSDAKGALPSPSRSTPTPPREDRPLRLGPRPLPTEGRMERRDPVQPPAPRFESPRPEPQRPSIIRQEPVHQAPVHAEPVHQAPVHQEPPHQAPPAHAEPAKPERK